MMDAAALVFPPASKEASAVVEKVESRQSERISLVVSPPIDERSRREEIGAVNIRYSTHGNTLPPHSGSINQLSSFQFQNASEEHKFASKSYSPISIPPFEGKQVRRRSGKIGAGSSGCSKRSRLGQMENLAMNEADANELTDKSQVAKPKNGLNGKRVDRRNGKISTKSKYDYFPLKPGMVSFSAGGGGNNSLGISGLKPEIYDISKHLDELTVKQLLDGHCKGSSLAKDKGKKITNLNDNILNSVRKACSILQRQKPLKIQNSAETDNNYSLNASAPSLHLEASKGDNIKGVTCNADMSLHDKVPAEVLDFSLCKPKAILERVGLPPSVDLDALLLDVAKSSASSSKDNLDSRVKQISHRVSSSPADAIKSSTNRSTCHSKWVKIENTAYLFEGRSGFLSELERLSYDPMLVPVKSMISVPSANGDAQCASVGFPSIDFGASSSATCVGAFLLPSAYDGGSLKCEEDAGDSPRSLTAAQTLCNIASHCQKERHRRMASMPSDNAIKPCKSKPINKFGEIMAKPKLIESNLDQVKTKETTSKKPRLLIHDQVKDPDIGRRGLVNWSMPRSSSQSHSRSVRDGFSNNRRSHNSFIMPPPPSSRVLDKSGSSRQRLR